jgi:hypothetical protein
MVATSTEISLQNEYIHLQVGTKRIIKNKMRGYRLIQLAWRTLVSALMNPPSPIKGGKLLDQRREYQFLNDSTPRSARVAGVYVPQYNQDVCIKHGKKVTRNGPSGHTSTQIIFKN